MDNLWEESTDERFVAYRRVGRDEWSPYTEAMLIRRQERGADVPDWWVNPSVKSEGDLANSISENLKEQ